MDITFTQQISNNSFLKFQTFHACPRVQLIFLRENILCAAEFVTVQWFWKGHLGLEGGSE